jgi:hypothetical protein
MSLAIIAVAGAPFVCLALLIRNFTRQTPLPRLGGAAIFIGGLLWIPILAAKSAMNPAWRPWIAAPVFAGTILIAVWQRRRLGVASANESSSLSSAGLFAVFGCLGYIVLGGGYFDRMFQVPHAREALRKAGVNASDPAALAQALRDPDAWVRWSAAIDLATLGPAGAPACGALDAATHDSDPRISRQALIAIRSIGPDCVRPPHEPGSGTGAGATRVTNNP